MPQKVTEAAADMATFYQQPFIGYTSRSRDTGELYTEVISRWCCEHPDKLSAIPRITRKASYKTPGHDGTTDRANSNREEERIAMKIFQQGSSPRWGRSWITRRR